MIGKVLIAWNKASQGNKEDSFRFLETAPKPFMHLIRIQSSLLQCYFDTPKTQNAFEQLLNDEKSSFSRYYFFLTNYLLSKDKTIEAKKTMTD